MTPFICIQIPVVEFYTALFNLKLFTIVTEKKFQIVAKNLGEKGLPIIPFLLMRHTFRVLTNDILKNITKDVTKEEGEVSHTSADLQEHLVSLSHRTYSVLILLTLVMSTALQ